jgi:hypothetical protein
MHPKTRALTLAALAALAFTAFSPALPAQDTTRVQRADSATADSATADSGAPVVAKKPAAPPRPAKPKPVWPVPGPLPLPGSILPNSRIVAFYGNPLSKRMGILGQIPPHHMLAKLDTVVASWQEADPMTPVVPALHFIAVVAQASAGRDGKYRARMADTLIDRVLDWAESRNAIVFLDLQVGKSTLQEELPRLTKYLSLPNVHLGIDPEFSMKNGGVPGKRIGTYDAADINYATRYLADLVKKHGLPPKILVVHRFTSKGVTNVDKIELDPNVQLVMHMDGFGPPWMKRDTYWRDIKREPVQFTGWKQFTKRRNDRPPTPRGEIMRLWPVPLYIQLQ